MDFFTVVMLLRFRPILIIIFIISIPLGIDDIALVLQQNRLRWHGHVLRKDDGDWVKKLLLLLRTFIQRKFARATNALCRQR